MAGLIIAPRARIFHGHEWVYATEIRKTFGDPQPGDVVTLKDFRDRPLGSAIYNPVSQIVARRFSRRRQDLDLDFFTRRIRQAIDYRERIGVDPTLCRLVWSESDGIPGLIIDRYGDHLTVQTLTLAMDMRKELVRDALVALLAPRSIVLRNDSPVRKAEGMETGIEMLHGENPGSFTVRANGLDFEVDLFDGQKTGLYLDQLQSHAEVAALAKGRRVLDCFTNQGGFALACAKAGAARVTAVDVSAAACEAARNNARVNGLEIEVLEHNVFDFLKHAKPDYDLIILDPPSFTRNKKTLMDAMRGYKEIHLRSLKLLDKGGVLSTFCCSHHASRELFLENLADASVDAKKSLRLVQEHSQRADHPVLITLPETGYLKGLTVEVIARTVPTKLSSRAKQTMP
jgi:23S rRNA (cytosine1962-C5)-methyltransferase